jgi:peptide/nickel transport system substrate-binding protein
MTGVRPLLMAAAIPAIAVPPISVHPEACHKSMEGWVKGFELDAGRSRIRPYEPGVGKRLTDMPPPSMGEAIPSDPNVIADSFGLGCWKADLKAGGELLGRAG